MRWPRIVFVGTTLGLGLACVYLANQLDIERNRTRAETDQCRLLESRIREFERARFRAGADHFESNHGASEAPRRVGSATSPADLEAPESAARIEDSEQADQRYRTRMLDSLSDPDARALLRVERQADLRRKNRGVAKALALTAAGEDRLTQLLAEQELKRMELNAQRAVVSHFESAADALNQTQRNELAALLGEEKLQLFERFQASQPERMQLDALRVRLDEVNGLNDAQENQLIAKMQHERTRHLEQLEQEGVANPYAPGYPFSPEFSSPDPLEQLARAEAGLEKTENFFRKLHAQAATVLSAEQLRRFDELQEEQLNWERMRVQSLRASVITTANAASGSRPW